MSLYSAVAIIYNPNSTGPSQRKAKALYSYLEKKFPETPIELIATKRAGHAEEIAGHLTKKYPKPLIISSSGDGGYNEVINGALSSSDTLHQPICAVLPTGNANDHARALHHKPLKQLILLQQPEYIDVLHATISLNGRSITRFAHSYIGMGLTPEIANELNRNKLTPTKELWITIKTFWNYDPLPIAKRGKNTKIQSFICSNIPHMAKRLTLSKDAKANDGTYELWSVTQASKLDILREIAKAAFAKLDPPRKTKTYRFTVIRDCHMQLDGETFPIKKNSEVVISLKHKALLTII